MRLPFLLSLVLTGAWCAETPAPPDFREVRQFIEQRIAEGPSPSAAVAVIRNGRVVWAEGFGYADRENQRKATADSIYWLASVSKPLTATALMTLVERGEIDLDRPANDYLPGAKLRSYAGDAREITIRRLASHTSGMPTHFNFFHEGAAPPPWDVTIRRYGFAVARPGTRQEYSNLGFGLLGYISELVSGVRWRALLERTVFDPLGMTRTSDHVRAGHEAEAAVPYWMDAAGRGIRLKPYQFDHPAASTYWGSANDLARFVRMHLNDGALDGVRILKPESAIAMRTPRRDPRAAEGFNEGSTAEIRYCIGWGVERFLGHDSFSHSGGMPGVATMVRVFPENKSAVIVLTNSDDRNMAWEVALRISRILVNEPSANAAIPAPVRSPNPPPELTGAWSGKLEHYDGPVPLRLRVQAGGAVEVSFGNRPPVSVRDAAFGQAYMTGTVDALLRTREDYHGVAPLQFRLWCDGNRLTGFAMATVTGYFGLSQFVELVREGPK
jgi:CubicO group peptidase (beta-lactamase class C family)